MSPSTKTKAKKPGGSGPPAGKPSRGEASAARWWLWLAAILAVTFVVYLPALDNEFTNWDDNTYVTDNQLIASPDFATILLTPIAGNLHPLTVWSLALNYRISGLQPASYHWLNLLLHLANTALVFVFVRRLSKGRFWTTAATALFFGIHPMHVESVAWVAERKDVLYAFFFLLGLTFYLRYLDSKRRIWLVPVFLACVLSLASKPAAVVFPVVLLLLDWYRRRKLTPAVLLEKLPFFLLAGALGYLTLQAQHSVGATAIQWKFFHKILFASYGLVMYVVKLFLPFGLSAIYPYVHYEGSTQGPGTQFYVAFAALLASIPPLVYLCRKSRVVLFGLLFFLVNIVLVLQFTTVGQAIMADRYTYVPYIGLLVALTWWLDARPGDAPLPGAVRPVLATCLLLLAPICAAQTWSRCDVWQNSLTLWNDTIGKYPGKIYDAYTHRGEYFRDVRRDYRSAVADFDRAINLNPGVARAWNFKGMALAQMNQIDSAAVCFERALTINPTFASALSNRGGVKLSRGDAAGAVVDFTRALESDPRIWGAYTNRALAYSILKQHENAIADLRLALRMKPGNPDNFVYVHAIGIELEALGRNDEAVREFDEAIRTTPGGDPRLGVYYASRSRARLALGDSTGARSDADEARRLGVAAAPSPPSQPNAP
ncbi:MAG TPA: tetratricopeptide repeat protein [Candidatus Eisenbacteria bacterium]|nr:tetratricopeptide repeat protein [Candidatus Eisenbacteria bacterium]